MLIQIIQILILVALMFPSALSAADDSNTKQKRLLVSLGQNLSWASRSDIRFQGEGYNFTVHDVSSHDELKLDYRPDRTQYVIRVLYYWNERLFVGMGMNHMKYIIDSQMARITGVISSKASKKYAGTYDQQIHIGEDGDMIAEYDHTDGVNFYDFQLGLTETIWASSDNTHQLSASTSLSAGFLWPRTKVIALDKGKNQPYHISGFGGATSILMRYHYGESFFADFALKAGWLNYVNAYSFEENGHSSQSYWFIEPMLTAGMQFQL